MARIKVVYFAGARDVVEKPAEFIETEAKSTAASVLKHLVKLHPGLQPMTRSLRLSVNQEIAEPDDRVKDGDEVGVLPPVAGG
ncbi:MAG: MoaD/ThiS family protein [Nitrososphaerota archaeon]|nr:MoaD/ThiS family protein [Nitrososphaerota archaeon]